jgi:peptidoglycan/LPS O-acetylase OafA/YrhL
LHAGSFHEPLHGLRGVMALWVVAYHIAPGGLGWMKVTSYGYIAVDVFFMLSGYILFGVHGHEFRRPDGRAALRFLALRAWRTWPLHVAAVALSLLVHRAVAGRWPSPARLAESLLMLEMWAAWGIGFNAPAWSLGVEWVGYLAFPAIAWCLVRLPAPAAALALAAVLAATILALGLGFGALSVMTGTGALTRMAGGFVAGALLAVLVAPRRDAGAPADFGFGLAALAIAAWLLVLPDYAVLPLLLAIVWLTAAPGRWVGALLSHPVALFLGRISFALYIAHFPLIKLLEGYRPSGRGLAALGFSGLVAAICLAAAWLLCRFVEEPMRRVGRRRWQAGAAR